MAAESIESIRHSLYFPHAELVAVAFPAPIEKPLRQRTLEMYQQEIYYPGYVTTDPVHLDQITDPNIHVYIQEGGLVSRMFHDPNARGMWYINDPVNYPATLAVLNATTPLEKGKPVWIGEEAKPQAIVPQSFLVVNLNNRISGYFPSSINRMPAHHRALLRKQ